MPRRVKYWAKVAAPRVIALVWAVWGFSTAYAYKDGPPTQLQNVEAFTHLPIWFLWTLSAVLLTIGALTPAPPGSRLQEVISWARGIGLAITVGLLGLWTIEFMSTEIDRGWVSGKNYLILALSALSHAWWVGRNRAPGPPEVEG